MYWSGSWDGGGRSPPTWRLASGWRQKSYDGSAGARSSSRAVKRFSICYMKVLRLSFALLVSVRYDSVSHLVTFHLLHNFSSTFNNWTHSRRFSSLHNYIFCQHVLTCVTSLALPSPCYTVPSFGCLSLRCYTERTSAVFSNCIVFFAFCLTLRVLLFPFLHQTPHYMHFWPRLWLRHWWPGMRSRSRSRSRSRRSRPILPGAGAGAGAAGTVRSEPEPEPEPSKTGRLRLRKRRKSKQNYHMWNKSSYLYLFTVDDNIKVI